MFGCLAFAYNPTLKPDKLNPRGVPCIFLGYPPNTKGFVLMNLFTQKRFVSRDVKFHEHIFPYNNATLKSILQPVPTDTPQTPSPLQYEDLSPIHLASDSVTQNTDEVPSSPADNPPPSLSQNRSEHIEPQTQQPEIRKSTRPRQEPFWMKDYKKVALNAELECSQR